MQSSLLIIDFKWLQVNLSRPRADKLLHFLIMSMSSFLKNRFHTIVVLSGISSRKQRLTSFTWVELNELWRAFHRSSSSIYRRSLHWIASTTGSLCFLTQFISFHRPHLLFVISSILSSKKEHLDFLTVLLKSFQFSRLCVWWYLSSEWWQSLFHQALECLVILTVFECSNHIFLFWKLGIEQSLLVIQHHGWMWFSRF